MSWGTIPPDLVQCSSAAEENGNADRRTDKRDVLIMCFYFDNCNYAKIHKKQLSIFKYILFSK